MSGKRLSRRSTARPVVLAASLVGAWAIVLACSTTSVDAPVLDAADVDAAVTEVVAVDVAPEAGPRKCRVGIPEPPPRWVPSHPFHRPLCTSEEVGELVATCLVGSDDAACDAFRAAHSECFDCAFTDDTASVYGANVVYREDNYRLVNFGGCMGNRTNQTGADGCGAAAALFDQCRTRSCHSCMPAVGDEGLAALGRCANDAQGSTFCAAEANRLARACNNALSPEPPEDPYEFCNRSTEGYIRLFCTALPDGGDAGFDAADAD